MKETGSSSEAPPVTTRSTFPRQHRRKDLSALQRDIHLVEIKYYEDTRPQNQLSTAQEQNSTKASAPSFKEPMLPSTPSFWEWVAPSTTITCWPVWPFKELGLDSERLKKLASSKIHVHSVNYAAYHVHTRRTLSSNIINFHQ